MKTTPKILKLIRSIAHKIAPKYTFGFYEVEDIEQEAIIIALEGLPRYNPELGALTTFLYTHINNRLKSFKRDNYYRSRVCPQCGSSEPSPDCESCMLYEWRAETRRNLVETISIDYINDQNEKNTHVYPDTSIEDKEIFDIIESKLPLELRTDYFRLKDGATISHSRKTHILEEIRNILNG